ncbi:MAG: ABC transporter ATP-binding protein [Tropicimonas sp.]|uniref:ABC transporter ATP-binding protein n=1 Tax=Tropicimonas sp. TaxID=2067044 RepID=UPI003A83815F
MAELDIKAVAKSYGQVNVLRDVDLHIDSGEFVVFVGPSGCGKSTLLRMISGLEDITAGTISIDGEVMNDVEPAARGISMVFQSYALYPHMTTFENVSFGLRMARQAREVIREKVTQAAEILKLDQLLDRQPMNLSGGQKQRVAIGRAIVREPRVFLFDEPLSNLDAELRVQMRGELMDLHERLDATMIYVTHDQVEAMTLADKMVVLNGGRIQQVGSPLDLYDDPDNDFVAGFVGSPKMNFLEGEVVEGALTGGWGEAVIPLPFTVPQARVKAGIRPEHLALLPAGDPAPEGCALLPAQVVFAEELGDVSYVHLRVADGTMLIARSLARWRQARKAGVVIDPAQLLLFDEAGMRIRAGAGAGRH